MKIPFFRNPPKGTNIDNLSPEEREKAKTEKWYYRINPCDWAAYEPLKKLRRLIDIAAIGTNCPCCIKARIWFALFIGNLIGVFTSSSTTVVLWVVACLAAIAVMILPNKVDTDHIPKETPIDDNHTGNGDAV